MLRIFSIEAAFSVMAEPVLAWLKTGLRSTVLLLAALLAVSACTRQWATDYGEPLSASVTSNWRVSQVQVTVPDSLSVSNENSFAPNADIVWHGDPDGDRRAQVKAITTTAVQQAVKDMRGSRPVQLDVVVMRFHGVTPITATRAPVAVQNMQFTAQVRDARTGEALTEPTLVLAEMPALLGEDAFKAAQAGSTQKGRVTAHIAATFRGWLGVGPDIRGTFVAIGK